MDDGVSSNLTLSLLDLLSNPVVFDNLIASLSLQSISRISRLSQSYRDFIFNTPRVFRYLDVSRCRGAYIPPTLTPIDSGGNSWRAERMDENLTEDEFYAGPLRGVLSKLQRKAVLRDVQVLVLDELASVTNDLVVEIATNARYNVKLLSIRKCINLNPSKLQQFLRYLCRPDRPEDSPKLQGVYYFTDPAMNRPVSQQKEHSMGVMVSDGATLGVLPTDKSRHNAVQSDSWYSPAGTIVKHGSTTRSSWEETLQACKGVIAFDAVLCSHMHEAMSECLHEASREFLAKEKPGIPTIATVALGPEGCSGCGQAPTGCPVWSEDNLYEFPLLWPPPYSGRLLDAVRPPRPQVLSGEANSDLQRLIVSCTWCLANRHCDSCHRWWCANCYNPQKAVKVSRLESTSDGEWRSVHDGNSVKNPYAAPHATTSHNLQPARYQPVPPNKPAVTRECWDCGRVCGPCAAVSARRCRRCRNEYCVYHNTGCDEMTCDWCMFRSGRGSRELY